MLTGNGGIVEVQATAETTPFTPERLDALLGLARDGVRTLFAAQRRAVEAGGVPG